MGKEKTGSFKCHVRVNNRVLTAQATAHQRGSRHMEAINRNIFSEK